METFEIYDDSKKAFKQMFQDIKYAKKYIFLETYIYDDDEVGKKLLSILIQKAKEGVKIKLLLDAWGGTAKKPFFEELTKQGAEVRFFREIQYLVRFISKNNERNHRKLLIIDNKITYIGSMNITKDCLDWRELVLRIKGDIAIDFAKSFYKSWEIFGKLNKRRIRTIIHKEYEIIHDIPSYIGRATKSRLYKLIKNAKKSILIETPYFIPSHNFINALGKAIKKGVKVELLIPHHSDVRIVDLARNRHLGRLYLKGVNIHYYTKKNMHSKLLLIDNSFFMLGSSNIDYRSLSMNYEINIVGRNKELIKILKEFFYNGVKDSRNFDYRIWKKRPSIGKMFELIIQMIRSYL